MALSAAELQKRHNLEGAPDPFPSLTADSPVKARASANGPTTPGQSQLDTNSATAFPSLARSASPNTAAAPAGGNSAWASRIKPAAKAPVFADSFTLAQIELGGPGRDGKQQSLGEVLKQVMQKYKVKIDAAANAKTRQTSFHLKADSQKDIDKAKRSLLALLSPVITLTIQAPASTIASIIGTKGATLKHIRDQTGVRVDIPPRDQTSNGHANDNGTVTPPGEDEEEPTVPVTVTGPNTMAYEAQAMLNAIIASKTSKASQRVKDIPDHILPFIIARRPLFLQAAQGADVQLALHAAEKAITVSGDREAVSRVTETIRTTIEAVKGSITSLKISLPKRQHRLLAGKAIDEIMVKSKCTVITAPAEDLSDEISVWGNPADLPTGLTAVMETANAAYIHEFPLPGPFPLSRQLLNYLVHINYPKTLAAAHPGVNVYTPGQKVVDRGVGSLSLDLVGEQKSAVDPVVRQVSEIIGKLIGATREVNMDWLVHKAVSGKNAKKIRQFHDTNNVSVFFPPESSESNFVLLVYDPLGANASPIPDEKSRNLDQVSAEILKFVKDAGQVKSSSITVEQKWHDAVFGENRTTLNAIIGEDKALSIKVGAEAGNNASEDVIVIRGPSADVERAIKEIEATVEKAKNDQIDNSYVLEWEVDREYVGRIVGSQGVGVNKLRDQLGVRVDVSDETDDKEVTVKRKKGGPPQGKSKVKITGREENVREAKKRILAQLERLADETSEVLKIAAQYHPGLIGQSGKYAIRLEEKYGVKITFPRQAHNGENGDAKATREPLKSDEVLIKGGRKGVAGAKSEIMEAVEFEKENNNTVKFTVPNRAVARILGKGGVVINEIKDETSTQIDIDKSSEDSGNTGVSIRGSKKNIAAAKASILAISDVIGEETSAVVHVEAKFHRTLIGGGGQGLRDLILRVGGPQDSRTQAGLIRFPRHGEQPSDEVRLRGEPKLVAKLQAELEKAVQGLKDRVVLAVDIPSVQHRALIGRGGQNLTGFQDHHEVQVQFPGSRAYDSTDEPANASEIEGVDPKNIVKVSGRRKAAEAAVADLKSKIKAPTPEAATTTVNVPLKYHHFVSQQGAFFRQLRNLGVAVDQSGHPSKSAIPSRPPAGSDAARIDDTAEGGEIQWEVTTNYGDAEDGESTWTLKGKDEAALEQAKEMITKAVTHAEQMSHVGYLTLPDRTHFARIVGSKGANVSRLRNETGAEITVGKEDSIIIIIGAEADILAAKDAIVKMTTETPARGPRRENDGPRRENEGQRRQR